MKNLEEIIKNFKELNQKFYTEYCLHTDCSKNCPFHGDCIASKFDDHLDDLDNLRLSIKKLFNGDGE